MYLAVMRRDNAFERVVTHHSAHETPHPPAREIRGRVRRKPGDLPARQDLVGEPPC
jgi:hypothetical protein